MSIYRYTSRPCAVTRVLHVAFNHDKGSFYNRLLEEVTVLGNCQEKKSSHLLSHRRQRTRENSFLQGHTACVPESRTVPRRARFPATTRHSFTRQTVKRPCSQHLYATETALLPILLLHGERCGPAKAPQTSVQGSTPERPDFSRQEQQRWVGLWEIWATNTRDLVHPLHAGHPATGPPCLKPVAPSHPHHPPPQDLMLRGTQ